MVITDLTTYDDVKARIELFEQMTTQWSSHNSLSMPLKAAEDESSPMEIDAQIGSKGRRARMEDQTTSGPKERI